MDSQEIDVLAYIKASKHRSEIVRELNIKIRTPAELSQLTGMRINHVSMYLRELMEHKIVICLNADSKKGRLYTLTDIGKKVCEVI